MGRPVIYSIRSYAGLAARVAAEGGFESGVVEARLWPDGEIHQRIRTPPSGMDVLLVAGTPGEADTLETFDLACALVAQGARSLTLGLAFFGYSTMEKGWKPGEAVTAKSRALLWSALPPAPCGNRILVLEPHTIGLVHFFESRNRVSGIDASDLIGAMLDGPPGEGSLLCSPDTGRIKWVDRLAGALGRPSAFVLKRRRADGGVQAFGQSGDVKGRDVILCDDMIRTGATLLEAAETCLAAGARSVSAAAIHGAFTPGTLEKLRSSGMFRTLRCSDSHPLAASGGPGWPEVTSCAALLAKAMAASLP